jgi:hypothetical protein
MLLNLIQIKKIDTFEQIDLISFFLFCLHIYLLASLLVHAQAQNEKREGENEKSLRRYNKVEG